MKKKFFIFILAVNLFNAVFAQKHDYIWVLGHNGGTNIDFNDTPPNIYFADRPTVMHVTNAIMSDISGQLLFYTNGCNIYAKNNKIMENGQDINPGTLHNEFCTEPFIAYLASRGATALPQRDSIYNLFHLGMKRVTTPQYDVFANRLYYTKVNMSQNTGMGKVVEKNKLIVEDTFQGGDLIAVKHGNLEDWWVIVPKRYSNKYFKIAAVSDGSMVVSEQIIGDSSIVGSSGGSQAVFSPDGSLYARYVPKQGILLFDFDRETGELSNYRHLPIPSDSAFAGGIAISPNSRFLYISAETKFYQYDLQASDISASQVLLAEYDGTVSPFATTFYNCQLAPDCKIYCNCNSSCNVFHVVNHPDEPGLACDFVQHGVQLATSNAGSIPNFPNYRLGSGQPVCVATEAGEVEKTAAPIKVFPNPATSVVTVSMPQALQRDATWSLHDQLGRAVRRAVLSAGQQEVQVSVEGLVAGLYFWSIKGEGFVVGSGKLIIQR
jgi:hypothetical protein